MPWINHPACQDGPVNFWRWIKFVVGSWMTNTGRRWEAQALDPEHWDEIPF